MPNQATSTTSGRQSLHRGRPPVHLYHQPGQVALCNVLFLIFYSSSCPLKPHSEDVCRELLAEDQAWFELVQSMSDEDLFKSFHCVRSDGEGNSAGAQRETLPMARLQIRSNFLNRNPPRVRKGADHQPCCQPLYPSPRPNQVGSPS